MKRYLILENGSIWEGEAFGADKEVISEIVFTTAMCGYVETLTDPSYTGQSVVQTFPLIGNYGVIPPDRESAALHVSAYIVREWCEHPSNFRSQMDIDTYLKQNGIPGLCGIDTRALTKLLREQGTMNGMITDDPSHADMEKIKSYKTVKPVDTVTVPAPEYHEADNAKYTVVMMDFGRKENILRSVLECGCNVWVLPSYTSAEDVLKYNPDGIFLTNGPGDPEDNPEIIENIKKLVESKVPIMGICLGHQLVALANGFRTTKLKYGHRGANQPVRNVFSGDVYITSQNHSYAVVSESINKKIADEFFVNVNDGTNEGILYKNAPVFTVQFHPEACGGPKDTGFLFEKFIELMGGKTNALK
ncbi:MAG: carbamoyl phosphate synthase small subunit [Firmicutes bacterium]|nr:carbamoyl phosphate synthase small subunit [Bacillota bacterium]